MSLNVSHEKLRELWKNPDTRRDALKLLLENGTCEYVERLFDHYADRFPDQEDVETCRQDFSAWLFFPPPETINAETFWLAKLIAAERPVERVIPVLVRNFIADWLRRDRHGKRTIFTVYVKDSDKPLPDDLTALNLLEVALWQDLKRPELKHGEAGRGYDFNIGRLTKRELANLAGSAGVPFDSKSGCFRGRIPIRDVTWFQILSMTGSERETDTFMLSNMYVLPMWRCFELHGP